MKAIDKRYRFKNDKNHYPMKPESIFAREDFLKKTKGINALKKQKCFLCSHDKFSILTEIDRYGFYYPTGICKVCGNIQQTKYYSEKTLAEFYSNYFRKIYENKNPQELFNTQKKGNGISIYHFVNSITNPYKVLEVGCGAGGILSVFKDKGCKVLGLDFDEDYLDAARKNGINVKNGSIDILEDSDQYDLIILSHVLEHITNPVLFLKKLSKHLNKNGLVFIEVPSIDNINLGDYNLDLLNYWQNAHVIHFTSKTLKLICKSAGLEEVKSTISIRSCWKLSERNNKISSSEKAISLAYSSDLIMSIEKKRKSLKGRIIVFKRFLYTSGVKLLQLIGIRGLIKSILYKVRK